MGYIRSNGYYFRVNSWVDTIDNSGLDYMLKQEVINRIINYYGNKYDYGLIPENCKSKEMLHIVCPEHGEFTVRIDYLGKPDEICPECRKIKKQKERFQKYIDKANKLFGENSLDFTESHYINLETPITLKCNKCGKYFTSRVDHLFDKNRFPCPYCGKKPQFPKEKLKRDFIKKAIEKFGDIYDFSNTDYINHKTKTTIICKKHGEVEILPTSFLNSSCGCPLCSVEKGIEKRKMSFENFVKKSKKYHGDRYQYDKNEYIDYYTPMKIYDKELKQYFYQKPYVHASGSGNKSNKSKGNSRINDWLISHNICFIPEQLIEGLVIDNVPHRIFVDFMFKYNNKTYIIEYNGEQHYKPILYYGGESKFEYQKTRDEWLRNYSKEKGYILLEIPYTYNSYDSIDQFLTENIK